MATTAEHPEAGDWLDQLADALGVPRLSPGEVEHLLDLAREVAHGTERRNTPLATFIVGRAIASGHSLDAAQRITQRLVDQR
ncbi:MAG: DUF6457 domain-containing protein [Acidimicrobiales bacterium]